MELKTVILFENELPDADVPGGLTDEIREHAELIFCPLSYLKLDNTRFHDQLLSFIKEKGIVIEDTLIMSNSKNALVVAEAIGLAVLPVELPMIDERFEGFKTILLEYWNVEFDFLKKTYERARNIPWEILRTERMIIREETEEDIPWMYTMYEQDDVKKFLEPLNKNMEDEIEYMRKYRLFIYGLCGYGIWHLEDIETKEAIGRAGLTPKTYEDDIRGVELGYMICSKYQNKGYCMEACKAILEFAKEALFIDTIYCLIRPDNELSKLVCKKLGFKFEKNIVDRERKMERYVISL